MNYYVQYPDASSLHVTVYVKFICTSPKIDKIADTKLKIERNPTINHASLLTKFPGSLLIEVRARSIKEGGGVNISFHRKYVFRMVRIEKERSKNKI